MTEVQESLLLNLLLLALVVGWLWYIFYPRPKRKGLVRVVKALAGHHKGMYTYHYRYNRWQAWFYSGEYFKSQTEAGWAADTKLISVTPAPRIRKPWKVVER
jgi:hypothetical protein